MKNLTSTYSRLHRLQSAGHVSALAVDPETDSVYVAIEHGETVEIGKTTPRGIEVRSFSCKRMVG
jgi:hypothetical protein